MIDAPAAAGSGGERAEKKKRTRRRTVAEAEQVGRREAWREGVMKHRADTPP